MKTDWTQPLSQRANERFQFVREMLTHLISKNAWTNWVGLRYLRSKKSSRFLSFITLISVFGVMLGVAALIVVLSVMDGFEVELKKRLSTTDLHVLIQPVREAPSFEQGRVPKSWISPEMTRILSSDRRIDSWTPVLQTEVIVKSGRKAMGLMIKGLPPERLNRHMPQVVETLSSPVGSFHVHEGDHAGNRQGIYLGADLASELDLIPGSEITLISPTETEGPFGGVPRMKQVLLLGIYRSGSPEQELHTAFADLASVESFLRRRDVVTQVELLLKNFGAASEIRQDLEKKFSGASLGSGYSKTQDWTQLNSHLLGSLKLERFAMFISLVFIVIVASFNIVTTLTLMCLEKKREMAILQAMGAKRSEIGAIFLAEGLWIGVLGTGLGLLLGLSVCWLLKNAELIQLPDIYVDRTLPVHLRWEYFVVTGFTALFVVLVGAIYPSARASKNDPLDGIRYG